jgi:hypothetical protein
VLIAAIAIGDSYNCVHQDWQCRRCLLSLVATATISDAHIMFTATFFSNSLHYMKEIIIL